MISLFLKRQIHIPAFFNKTYGQKEIRTICEDRNGWIWVGTSEGVFVFDPDRIIKDPNDFYQYNLDNHALKSNEIKSIIQDKKGRIWIAESGIGFCVANIKNDYKDISFTHYTVNDGLVHSVVQASLKMMKEISGYPPNMGFLVLTRKTKYSTITSFLMIYWGMYIQKDVPN